MHETVPLINVEASKDLDLKVDLAAAHPGDASIFISCDGDFPADKADQMKFFKIANAPQQRLLNKLGFKIKLSTCSLAHRQQRQWQRWAGDPATCHPEPRHGGPCRTLRMPPPGLRHVHERRHGRHHDS